MVIYEIAGIWELLSWMVDHCNGLTGLQLWWVIWSWIVLTLLINCGRRLDVPGQNGVLSSGIGVGEDKEDIG